MSARLGIFVIAVVLALGWTGGSLGSARPAAAAPTGITWTRTGDLPLDLGGAGVAAAQGYLFALGGVSGNGTIESASVYRGTLDGTGNVTWSSGSVNSLPTGTQGLTAPSDGTHVYAIGGGSSGVTMTKVLVSTVSPAGAMSAWSETVPLPVVVTGAMSEIVGDYVYVIGGGNTGGLSSVYYNRINPDGTLALDPWLSATSLPGPRWWHASTTIGNHIYVSGGTSTGYAATTDVWRADVNLTDGSLSAWATMQSLPVARSQHVMAALGGHLYAIAGNISGDPPQRDTVYSIDTDGTGDLVGTWDLEPNAYGEAIHLAGSSRAVLNGRIYVVGGDYDYPYGESNRTYYSAPPAPPAEWMQLAAMNAPGANYSQSLVYDSLKNRLLMFGGEVSEGSYLGDLWEFPLPAGPWHHLTPTPDPINGSPIARRGHSAVWDVSRGEMLIFGGHTCWGCNVNDIWAYDSATEAWAKLPASGDIPYAGYDYQSVWDSTDDQLLVFGGYQQSYIYHNELWAYERSSNTWTQLTPTGGPPPPRQGGTAVWDTLWSRMLVFGGGNSGGRLGDFWAYTPTTNSWQEITTPAAPPARGWPAAAWDAGSGRMVIYGGQNPAGNGFLHDTWSYSSSSGTWALIATSGDYPDARLDGAMAWTVDGRFFLYGGSNGISGYEPRLHDFWSLSSAEFDSDSDGIRDATDDCPLISNPDQRNIAHPLTAVGDACEDPDGDSISDVSDNCPDLANADQLSTAITALSNGPSVAGDDTTDPNVNPGLVLGDACNPDRDHDGRLDTEELAGTGCASATGDGKTDVSASNGYGGINGSPPSSHPSWDTDGDTVPDGVECQVGADPKTFNATDRTACANFFGSSDVDGDGLTAAVEKCKWNTDPNNANTNGVGLGDCREAYDVNGNGIMNTTDATLVLRAFFLLDIGDLAAEDVNGNGMVNSADATLIKRAFFGLDPCM